MITSNNSEIYVYLEDEGVDVWRPVQALRLENDHYQIVSENPYPEDERWQFSTGDIVRCKKQTFADGKTALAAVEKISSAI